MISTALFKLSFDLIWFDFNKLSSLIALHTKGKMYQ